jgi:hypothetical protein
MVKLVQCVRRRADVSVADFRDKWKEYGELIRAGSVSLGGVRCTLSTTLAVKENLLFSLRRGTQEPFDGIAEIWFENAPAALAALRRPDWSAGLAKFQAFQESFVDVERSSFFFAIEDEVFDWSSELG